MWSMQDISELFSLEMWQERQNCFVDFNIDNFFGIEITDMYLIVKGKVLKSTNSYNKNNNKIQIRVIKNDESK